jgi:hypothetical protein
MSKSPLPEVDPQNIQWMYGPLTLGEKIGLFVVTAFGCGVLVWGLAMVVYAIARGA